MEFTNWFLFQKKEQSTYTLLAIIAKYSVSVGDWTTERAIGTSNAMKFVVFFEKCLKELVTYPENSLCDDVNRRTIEIPQHTRNFKANHCLKGSQCTLQVSKHLSTSSFCGVIGTPILFYFRW